MYLESNRERAGWCSPRAQAKGQMGIQGTGESYLPELPTSAAQFQEVVRQNFVAASNER